MRNISKRLWLASAVLGLTLGLCIPTAASAQVRDHRRPRPPPPAEALPPPPAAALQQTFQVPLRDDSGRTRAILSYERGRDGRLALTITTPAGREIGVVGSRRGAGDDAPGTELLQSQIAELRNEVGILRRRLDVEAGAPAADSGGGGYRSAPSDTRLLQSQIADLRTDLGDLRRRLDEQDDPRR